MTTCTAPIGVFDSGLGGLSVLREVRSLLPHEDLIYAADSAYCPYGSRPPNEILERTMAVAGALADRGIKILIVACNTACSVALFDLRARFDMPIIGLEPAVKPAVGLTRSGRIGVLATPRTVNGERLAALVRTHANGTEVVTVPAPDLVELVEAGITAGDQVEAALKPLISPLLDRAVDTLVLGCTHYPFLRPAMQEVAGPHVRIIDSGEAIARRTRDVLERSGLRRTDDHMGNLEVLTTGDAADVSAISSRLLGATITATRLAV